jgi:uncharacterized protein with HEPN domain
MATRSALLRIHDMLESIRGIEKAIAGKTLRDYERSWLLRSAVERGIEVISRDQSYFRSQSESFVEIAARPVEASTTGR